MPSGERAPIPLFGHPGTSLELEVVSQSDDFRVNPDLDGRRVAMRGFVVPLELSSGKLQRFLLVPYFGACIHLPPPPPNQVVDVTLARPVRLFNQDIPVTVRGSIELKSSRSALASSAYTIEDGRILKGK